MIHSLSCHRIIPRPESLGIVCGAFYLVTVFTYIPFNFLKIDFNHLNLVGRFRLVYPILKSAEFEQNEVTCFIILFFFSVRYWNSFKKQPGLEIQASLLI